MNIASPDKFLYITYMLTTIVYIYLLQLVSYNWLPRHLNVVCG